MYRNACIREISIYYFIIVYVYVCMYACVCVYVRVRAHVIVGVHLCMFVLYYVNNNMKTIAAT